MSSKIEWLVGLDNKHGETINPWGWGCYGPGGSAERPNLCCYCYAKILANRKLRKCSLCQQFVPHWHPEQLEKPLHWKKPRRIFVASMSDPFGCYDDQTEVLTKSGWKYFVDIVDIDELAYLDPIDHSMKYSTPSALVSLPYDGLMYSITTQSLNLVVTPNHKMLVALEPTTVATRQQSR